MNIYFSNLWNKVITGFWFVPGIMIILVFILASFTLHLDHSFEFYDLPFQFWVGGADGARDLLSTIAKSMIALTGVVFSITAVALALTSNLYGSKLLPSFMRDLVTQVTLGTFISTSIYALLILRTIGNENYSKGKDFVPNISITSIEWLAILSLIMLIYFIHHLSVRVNSSDIITRVANNLTYKIESLKNLSTDFLSSNELKKEYCQEPIFARYKGYLQAIDYKCLFHYAQKYQFIIEISLRPGHFISKGMLLSKINKTLPDQIKKKILRSFIIGKERNATQDLEYAIDQLVAIALRAIGTSANDTFAVNACVDHLGDALCLICKKDLSVIPRDKEAFIKLTAKQQTFKGLVDASFNQIRQYGGSSPSILIHLLETLTSILTSTQTQEQREVITHHAKMIQDCKRFIIEKNDCEDIEERFGEFLSALQRN
jgi:uncharacterized membrane protein